MAGDAARNRAAHSVGSGKARRHKLVEHVVGVLCHELFGKGDGSGALGDAKLRQSHHAIWAEAGLRIISGNLLVCRQHSSEPTQGACEVDFICSTVNRAASGVPNTRSMSKKLPRHSTHGPLTACIVPMA